MPRINFLGAILCCKLQSILFQEGNSALKLPRMGPQVSLALPSRDRCLQLSPPFFHLSKGHVLSTNMVRPYARLAGK